MNCNFCKNKINTILLDLGKTPPANSLIYKNNNFLKEKKFELIVYLCKKCWLVQTKQVVNKKVFFNNKYPYYSSISETWLFHVKQYVKKITKKLNLRKSSKVIEIASNDGYLLQFFKKKKIPCLGIEPTKNTAKICIKKGIKVIQKFFSYKLSKLITEKADLVICNNVLAHVPDIVDFLRGLENTIKENGTITIEFPHLKSLIKNTQFDTIYHEHYFYLSLITLNKIISKLNLKIYDVEKIKTHGGSLRVYICKLKSKKKITNKVFHLIRDEKKFGLNKIKRYLLFKNKVKKVKENALKFINDCKIKNKTIHAYGAAAKGITFFNYLGIKKNIVEYVYDASKFKINKYLPLSHIPILNPINIKKYKPDFIIILPWNIKKEIMSQLKFAKKWNCKFVTFVPNIKIH